MEHKKLAESNDKDTLIKRLKRIEGQVKGVQNMINDERYCVDILIQISAIRSAINRVGTIVLENHIKGCVSESLKSGDIEKTDEVINELMNTINNFIK